MTVITFPREKPPPATAGGAPFSGFTHLFIAVFVLALFSALGCGTVTPPLQDPGQRERRAGQATCDLDHLPAQQEFITAIALVLDTPEETVRLTRLKPWPEQCCSSDQLEGIAQQGGRCTTGACWTALAEARVPPTEDRGREHVGFYVYTGRCAVYHDYHYRYGWQLGKP